SHQSHRATHPNHLHTIPTRRSSDLARSQDCVEPMSTLPARMPPRILSSGAQATPTGIQSSARFSARSTSIFLQIRVPAQRHSREQVPSRPLWLLRGQPFPGTSLHFSLPRTPPACRTPKTLPCSCASDLGCTCASSGSCSALLPCSKSRNGNCQAPPQHHRYRSTHNR